MKSENMQVQERHEEKITVPLTLSNRFKIGMELLILAGAISLIFLVVFFSYQQLLLFTANYLGFDVSYWILENPNVYQKGINFIIIAYVFILVISLTSRYIQSRDRIVLEQIRHYISDMAQGKHYLRIPTQGAGEYEKLARDVNTLMDNIQEAFMERQEAEKAKDELFNNLGHDIRTPLTSIIGYLGLLKSQGAYISKEDAQKYLDIAYQKSKNMQILLNDLFEYTSSQKTTASMNFTEVPLNKFLEQVAVEFSFEAQQKNIDLLVENEMADDNIYMDLDKFIRIMNNLISNALKYGYGASHIIIHSFGLDTEEYADYTQVDAKHLTSKHRYVKEWVIIEVRNNGQLIEEDQLEKIFDRTYRADKARNSNQPGSGLGLAIVRNFVKLHKGHVYAVLEGGDLVFRIEIPRINHVKVIQSEQEHSS